MIQHLPRLLKKQLFIFNSTAASDNVSTKKVETPIECYLLYGSTVK